MRDDQWDAIGRRRGARMSLMVTELIAEGAVAKLRSGGRLSAGDRAAIVALLDAQDRYARTLAARLPKEKPLPRPAHRQRGSGRAPADIAHVIAWTMEECGERLVDAAKRIDPRIVDSKDFHYDSLRKAYDDFRKSGTKIDMARGYAALEEYRRRHKLG